MADAVDWANDQADRERAAVIAERPVFDLAAGRPGECDDCGRWAERLVRGLCAPCRDFQEHQNRG